MKKLLLYILTAMMIFAFAACGNDETDGQNPIMNFVGDYSADRALLHVEADGDSGAKITVNWGSSAREDADTDLCFSIWEIPAP